MPVITLPHGHWLPTTTPKKGLGLSMTPQPRHVCRRHTNANALPVRSMGVFTPLRTVGSGASAAPRGAWLPARVRHWARCYLKPNQFSCKLRCYAPPIIGSDARGSCGPSAM